MFIWTLLKDKFEFILGHFNGPYFAQRKITAPQMGEMRQI